MTSGHSCVTGLRPIFTLLILLFLVIPPASQGADATDDARLKALILEVIRENPEVIYESLNTYLKNQRQAQADQELEQSFKNRREFTVPPHSPWQGSSEAPITIVEFTDFQCQYCARGAATLKQLARKYTGKIKIVFRHNPLKFHEQARPAALAAMAAHEQGKFWEYHDLLFQNVQRFSEEIYVELAGQLELDLERFNRMRASESVAQQVDADLQKAQEHKFTGTPMFIVNGIVVHGAKPMDYFSKVIDRLLEEQAAATPES